MESFLHHKCIIMHALHCMYSVILGLGLTLIMYKDPVRTAQ